MSEILEKIGTQVAHNLADHFETVTIPAINVCIYQLEKIKKQLEDLKEPVRRSNRNE